MTRNDLIDALTRNIAGKPSSLCDWRDLIRVRDTVDELLNREVDRRQNAAAPEPARAPAPPLARGVGSTTDRRRALPPRADSTTEENR